MASLGLKKMFYTILKHLIMYGKILCAVIFGHMFFYNILRADVMPQCYVARCYPLPDVIAI